MTKEEKKKAGRPKDSTIRPEPIRVILRKCNDTLVYAYSTTFCDLDTDSLKMLKEKLDARTKELGYIKKSEVGEEGWQITMDYKRKLESIIKQLNRFMKEEIISENDRIVNLKTILPSVQRRYDIIKRELFNKDITYERYTVEWNRLFRIERRILHNKPSTEIEDPFEKDRVSHPDYKTEEIAGITRNFDSDTFYTSGSRRFVESKEERDHSYNNWGYTKDAWYFEDISGMALRPHDVKVVSSQTVSSQSSSNRSESN